MNESQRKFKMIVNVVVSASVTAVEIDGQEEILMSDIFSKSKRENVVRARTLLAVALHKYGYTVEDVCKLLDVSRSAVCKMFAAHEDYKRISRIYELTCNSVRSQIEAYRKQDDEYLQKIAAMIEQ